MAEEEERHARGFLDETSPAAKNHVVPYIGHLRVSEVSRETFFNLLTKVLPAEEASQVTVRAARKVPLSAMCHMAFVAALRGGTDLSPASLYARLNVTTWARRSEMIGFRPCDFDFGQQMLNVTRSTVYVTARYHPAGKAGWLTKPHPKNGDWRRFAISFRRWSPRPASCTSTGRWAPGTR